MAEIRVQKFLSRAGVASRRHAETMMQAGRVQVNGKPVTELGAKLDPARDVVDVDGRRVTVPEPRWIALHKPQGYITTRRDIRGRRTVYDLLPPGSEGLRYVGRLDRATEGLLLFTNEGEAANALLHPSRAVEREYEATVEGRISMEAMRRLERGIELEDGPARAEGIQLRRTEGDRSVVRLVVREGRKHEVRRLLEAVHHPVVKLKRVRFGPLALGSLQRGRFRELSREEIRAVRAAGDAPRDRSPRR